MGSTWRDSPASEFAEALHDTVGSVGHGFVSGYLPAEFGIEPCAGGPHVRMA